MQSMLASALVVVVGSCDPEDAAEGMRGIVASGVLLLGFGALMAVFAARAAKSSHKQQPGVDRDGKA